MARLTWSPQALEDLDAPTGALEDLDAPRVTRPRCFHAALFDGFESGDESKSYSPALEPAIGASLAPRA